MEETEENSINTTTTITLYQFGSHPNVKINDFPLPSFDPFCMSIQVYLRFCGVEFTTVNSPYNGGKVWPGLSINNGKMIHGCLSIIENLKRSGFELEQEKSLSLVEQADNSSFINYIADSLYNCQLYNWWVEADNYNFFTHRVYSSKASFPFSLYIPYMMRYQIIQKLKSIDYTTETQAKVNDRADQIFKSLSIKLADKIFFLRRFTNYSRCHGIWIPYYPISSDTTHSKSP